MSKVLWRVYQCGKFVGYVRAFVENTAWEKAERKYGGGIRVERVDLGVCTA